MSVHRFPILHCLVLLNILKTSKKYINTNSFLTFWHTSVAVGCSTTKYVLHTEAWRAFLSHYFKYAVPVNCLSNTGVYSSTEEQVNVCCLSRKKAKRRHKNWPAPGLFMAHWANFIHTGDFKKLTSLPHTTKNCSSLLNIVLCTIHIYSSTYTCRRQLTKLDNTQRCRNNSI